jgi:hypothetical protein
VSFVFRLVILGSSFFQVRIKAPSMMDRVKLTWGGFKLGIPVWRFGEGGA